MTGFLYFERFETISSGQFYAEDNSSFDNLEFKRKRAKRWSTAFQGSTVLFFISTEIFKTARQTLQLDSSSVLDSLVFHLDRPRKEIFKN